MTVLNRCGFGGLWAALAKAGALTAWEPWDVGIDFASAAGTGFASTELFVAFALGLGGAVVFLTLPQPGDQAKPTRGAKFRTLSILL